MNFCCPLLLKQWNAKILRPMNLMLTFKQKAWQLIRYTTVKNRPTRNALVLFIFENPSFYMRLWIHRIYNKRSKQQNQVFGGHDEKCLLLWMGSDTGIKVSNEKLVPSHFKWSQTWMKNWAMQNVLHLSTKKTNLYHTIQLVREADEPKQSHT